ncbi:MAG: hypothetical protein FJ207_00975 [Gemmatimonadetes bacterium]|nr:hypothetical protein [Gemmatimonadota bacterium]
MRANPTARPFYKGRSTDLRRAAALVAALALPGCAGENLFTGSATVDQGPQVEITAPATNTGVAAGDSVQVTANITGPRGLSQVTFTGAFTAGGTAFTAQTVTLANPPDTTVSRFMKRSGATTGNATIIVEATDALGDKGADTVAVVLN